MFTSLRRPLVLMFVLLAVVSSQIFVPAARADVYTKHVDFAKGDDTVGDGSVALPWRTLYKATTGHGLALQAGDTYNIEVIPSSQAVNDHVALLGANLTPGVNVVVEPQDGTAAIRLGSESCAQILTGWLTGSLTLRHVIWAGSGHAVTVSEGGARDVDIVLENCTLSLLNTNHVLWLSNAGNTGHVRLSACTITDCRTLVSGGLSGDITVENCTVNDCERLICVGTAGQVAMTSNAITAGADAEVPAPLLDVQTVSGLDIEGNLITGTNLYGSSASLYNNMPILRGNGMFRFARNTVNLFGTGMTGCMLKIPDITSGGTLDVVIEDNVVRSNTGSFVILLGLQPVPGQTRAQTYAASSQLWGNVSIARNTVITTAASGGALWLMVGPNGAQVTDNFIKGGSAAHTFEVAADNCVISGNVSTGQLPLMIFGDNCEVHNNTTLATSGNGCLLGRPSATPWEVSVNGNIHHNLFCTLGSDSNNAALNDYAYSYSMAPYGLQRPMNHKIDYNCYWAPEAYLLDLNSLGCGSLEEARNVWSTGTLNGRGSTPWDAAHPDNDIHSISVNPRFVYPVAEYRAGFTPQAASLVDPEGNYIGALVADVYRCPADLNGDDSVDTVDLLIFIDAWGSQWSANWNRVCDINGDDCVVETDMQIFEAAWGGQCSKNWDANCDLNNDGMVDAADLRILSDAWGKASFPGDVNGDGTVDTADVLAFVDSLDKRLGDVGYDPACDFNADNVVDDADLQILMQNLGRFNPGDLNGDGRVDESDLAILEAALGTQCSANWNAACDFNSDGFVDTVDLRTIMAAMGSQYSANWNPTCDLNNDGSVDTVDLLTFIEYWGQ